MAFASQRKVSDGEIDALDIVFFPHYIYWAAEFFLTYLRHEGSATRSTSGGYEIRVVGVKANYKASARRGDSVDISVNRVTFNGSLVEILVGMAINGNAVAKVKLTVAYVESSTNKLIDIPEDVIAIFKKNCRAS
jgi:acyl-CoA thioesterase FadM